MSARAVSRVIDAVALLEGGGFPVRRPFPTAQLNFFDPFLLLDHMGPVNWGPGKAIGAPDHPHRGFETVTYLLEGRMQHRDSRGHFGDLGPGDAQWMTAGAGVVHSELPHPDFLAAGGVMHGFQLWVNLPAAEKMIAPRYQDIPAAQIPVARDASGGVTVRVIAGAALGTSAVIDTRIPITFLHFTLAPGAVHTQELVPGHNALVYVIRGAPQAGPEPITLREGQMGALGEDGDSVTLRNAADANGDADLLLLAGPPLNEPVARHGPFVMNTREEIDQAIADFRDGRIG